MTIIVLAGKPVSVQLLSQQLCGCVGHLEVQEILPDLFCLRSHTKPSGKVKSMKFWSMPYNLSQYQKRA
jgi:hypothetical protein